MYGLASILPEPYYTQVERIWDKLENCCGLTSIRETPYPHFSWQIAHSYPMEQLTTIVEHLSARIAPFPLRTSGLGIFSGPMPVIYIAVVKDSKLATLHHQIWERLAEIVHQPSPYYHPDRWVPHITLAYNDVTPHNIGSVAQMIAFENYNWEMTIDNLTIISFPDHAEQPVSIPGAAIRRYPLLGIAST
jgi:2'-5' RNA ligase